VTGGRVVVGVSTSASSAAALRRGVQEAWRSGRVLVPLHAWGPPEGEILYAKAPSPLLTGTWERLARERFADVLTDVLTDAVGVAPGPGPGRARFAALETPSGLRIEPLLVRAPAWHALVAVAAEPEDLLVLGGGGRGPVLRLLRGTVRRRVLAGAVCPVLTVGPPSVPRSARRALRRSEPCDFALG
jgi:nucleotide-binding universal stress UspA family protein